MSRIKELIAQVRSRLDSLSPRDRRAVIWGVAGVAAVLFYALLLDPAISSHKRNSAQLDAKLSAFAESIKIAARKDKILAAGTEAEKIAASLSAKSVPGETPSVAAAELQNILNQMAKASKISIAASRADKPVEGRFFTEVTVDISFTSSLAQLRQLIVAIESNQKRLVIRGFNITAADRKNEEVLKTELTVSGFAANSAPPAGPDGAVSQKPAA